jgi:hypothetical protein
MNKNVETLKETPLPEDFSVFLILEIDFSWSYYSIQYPVLTKNNSLLFNLYRKIIYHSDQQLWQPQRLEERILLTYANHNNEKIEKLWRWSDYECNQVAKRASQNRS